MKPINFIFDYIGLQWHRTHCRRGHECSRCHGKITWGAPVYMPVRKKAARWLCEKCGHLLERLEKANDYKRIEND